MSGRSPDGLVGTDGLLELKCPNTSTHIDTFLEGGIPTKYEYQTLWQMVARDGNGAIGSYDPRMPDGMSASFATMKRSPRLSPR